MIQRAHEARALRARASCYSSAFSAIGALLLMAAPARAEGDPGPGVAAVASAPSSSEEANPSASDQSLTLSAPPTDTLAPTAEGAREASNYYLGVRYRALIIPELVLDWFMDGGRTVYVHGVGPELSIRDGSAEYNLSAWVAFYGLEAAIKGHQNEEEAREIIESDIKSLYLTADFLWHHPLTNKLDLSYGGGVGMGFIFGDLYRTQAYLVEGGTPGNPDDYQPCAGVGQPDDLYCDDFNEHYPGYSEPSWTNGGAKPTLFPWLAAQVGLRYQPDPQVVTRLDVGLGLSGIMLGVAVDYGL